MNSPTLFYSWQSDLPGRSTRQFIRDATEIALQRVSFGIPITDSPRLDHDTQGHSGTPAVSETIYHKIKGCAIFLADVSFVGIAPERDGRQKHLANPNVLIELGYAAAVLGWDRVMLVMNRHYGSPESLPFDLRNRRFPTTFKLGPNSERFDAERKNLVPELEAKIRSCLQAEYDRVEDVMSRLSNYTRKFMLDNGEREKFYETKLEDQILTRFDLAILQLLELGVLRCVEASGEAAAKAAYSWTYLGRRCLNKLGLQPSQAILGARSQMSFPISFFDPTTQSDPCYPIDTQIFERESATDKRIDDTETI